MWNSVERCTIVSAEGLLFANAERTTPSSLSSATVPDVARGAAACRCPTCQWVDFCAPDYWFFPATALCPRTMSCFLRLSYRPKFSLRCPSSPLRPSYRSLRCPSSPLRPSYRSLRRRTVLHSAVVPFSQPSSRSLSRRPAHSAVVPFTQPSYRSLSPLRPSYRVVPVKPATAVVPFTQVPVKPATVSYPPVKPSGARQARYGVVPRIVSAFVEGVAPHPAAPRARGTAQEGLHGLPTANSLTVVSSLY